MIKAIIFDFFGVMVTDGWLKFLDTYLPSGENRTKARDLNHAVDKGAMSYESFISEVSVIAKVDKKVLNDMMSGHLKKNELLLEFITGLKDRYKIGILSNVARPKSITEHLTNKELALFDDVLPSVSVGMIKPQPEIYKLAAERLGAQPQECIFIDDREPYVAGAGKVGMQTIQYHDFNQMKIELEALLAKNE